MGVGGESAGSAAAGGAEAGRSPEAGDRPLAGLLVLDFSQGIAGPFAGRLLADAGARVIKIEPPAGDWMRTLGAGPEGTSSGALFYNLGKESVVLDLKAQPDRDRALALAARADVLIESARPGAMERLGLGFEAVRALNPRILYLSVSGFGRTGPRAAEPLTDTAAQAFSGWMSVNRAPDGTPVKSGMTVIDAVTGMFAFQALLLALWPAGEREARHLDVSLMQSAAALLGPKIVEAAHLGREPGLFNPPAGTYRTADGWIAVTLVTEAQFRAIAEAVGAPELAEDPRFATFAARAAHEAELRKFLADRIAARPTAEWLERFGAAGALASPVNTLLDWLAEPQVAATDAAPASELRPGAALPCPRIPAAPGPAGPAPALGEHTEAVLREFGLL